MFGWRKKEEDKKQEVTATVKTNALTVEDMQQHTDAIAVMCLRKCVNDADEPDLNAGQRVCLKRCANKIFSSVEYANRIAGYLELKVNRFQDLQAPQLNNTTQL